MAHHKSKPSFPQAIPEADTDTDSDEFLDDDVNVDTLQQEMDSWVRFEEPSLNETLESIVYGDSEGRIWAAREIGRLCRSSAKNRSYFGECGAIGPLVPMLGSSDLHTQDAALQALHCMSLKNDMNKIEITEEGALPYLKELLQSENIYMKESAASVILSLSATDENQKCIGESGIIPLLVGMLSTGTLQGKANAVVTLSHLSLSADNLSILQEAGAVLPLLQLLKSWRKSSVCCEKIVDLLDALSTHEENAKIIVRGGGILALVEVIEEGTYLGQEYSASTLLNICERGRYKHKQAILKEGVIPGLLSLTVEGTCRAKAKAKALLQLLREPLPRRVGGSESLEKIVKNIAAHVPENAKSLLSQIIRPYPSTNIWTHR